MESAETSELTTPDALESAAEIESASPNPFSSDVCRGPLGVVETASVPGLNADVLDQLSSSLEHSSGGPLILLTAPRAGYGKTHLLGRVAAAAGEQSVVVPLAFRTGDTLTLSTVCKRGLEALNQSAGERAGWTRLRETNAGVVVALMHQLIEKGLLTCANQEQALSVLSGPAIDIFDEDSPAKLIGEWLSKYRQQLSQPLAALAAKEIPVRQEVLGEWIEAMLDHAADGGVSGLAAMNDLAAMDSDSSTPAWLRLVGLWRQPVLMVDHLDGFYRNAEAGITIASLLMDLADGHGVHVLLSLNQDVWQATFGHHLPSALEDRLTNSQVLLRGLSAGEATELVKLRLQTAGIDEAETKEFGEFLALERYFLGRPLGSVSARAFLRHTARQWEIFQNSVPSPVETGAVSAPESTSRIFPQDDDASSVPLMTETVNLESSANLPEIFDSDTGAYMKEIAAGLAEPIAALPQNEPVVSQPLPTSDWASTPSPLTEETGGTQPSADAFVKLREMLGRLRQPNPSAVTHATEEPAPPAVAPPQSGALLGRFEALRLQMSAEADSQPLDFTKLGELIRLAGRRFPLVRFTEHELPGMTGRSAMWWSLQGVEILFGLANFRDYSYWKTLSNFASARLAELASEQGNQGGATTKLKLVTFKTDREQAGYQGLVESGVIAESLRENLDGVHLDTGNVASLYAMQRIIKEAETGDLQVEPSQVMSALARELDFFWKRVTRVG